MTQIFLTHFLWSALLINPTCHKVLQDTSVFSIYPVQFSDSLTLETGLKEPGFFEVKVLRLTASKGALPRMITLHRLYQERGNHIWHLGDEPSFRKLDPGKYRIFISAIFSGKTNPQYAEYYDVEKVVQK